MILASILPHSILSQTPCKAVVVIEPDVCYKVPSYNIAIFLIKIKLWCCCC